MRETGIRWTDALEGMARDDGARRMNGMEEVGARVRVG